MRAITIRQPWAWAVAHAGKTVENRTALTGYRGTLLVHAGAAWSARGARDPRVVKAVDRYRQPREHSTPVDPASTPLFPMRAVIAVAQLVDAHPDSGCCRPWGESEYEEAGGRTRRTVVHLLLEQIEPLSEPVPWARGALGLWTPPLDLVLDVEDLARAVAP